jgi:AraC-like DNA-binding protein
MHVAVPIQLPGISFVPAVLLLSRKNHEHDRWPAGKRPSALRCYTAKALENALPRPLPCEVHEETSRRRERTALAKRFEAAVEENIHQQMLIPDLCRAIGVTERRLSEVCQEQLSLSPLKYMTLRRLQMTREALLRLDQRSGTVTEIATSFGFWELGRFSGAYKALFGELPSETLRRTFGLARK